MERYEFDYPAAKRRISKKHTSVSLVLEIWKFLMEPAEAGERVYQSPNQREWLSAICWKAIMDRFFAKFDGPGLFVYINDAAHTLGLVLLRLEQAVEEIATMNAARLSFRPSSPGRASSN